MVVKFVNDANQSDWDIYIGLLVLAYNTFEELKSLVGVRERDTSQFACDEAIHRQHDCMETATGCSDKQTNTYILLTLLILVVKRLLSVPGRAC